MKIEDIRKKLEKFPRESAVAFAYRCALRSFPILGKDGNFDYWVEKDRKTNIVSLFRALDFSAAWRTHATTIPADVFVESAAYDDLYAAAHAAAAHAVATVYAYAVATIYAAAAAAARAAAYAAAVGAVGAADAFPYGKEIETEMFEDLAKLAKGVNLLKLPVWTKEPANFIRVHRAFEKGLESIGFEFWIEVFNEHLENRIDGDELEKRLNVPPEIVSAGGEEVTNYLISLKGETSFTREVKVHFVGNGGVGKTSLRDLIQNRNFDENRFSTKGVEHDEIVDIQISQRKNIKAYLWDFGGQEKMYPVHTFFFSEKSLYILVLASRREEDPEDWLEMITSYTGDCKILIVFNKHEQNSSFDLNRKFLTDKYPNIAGFFPLSCRKRDDYKPEIEKFRAEFGKTLETAGYKKEAFNSDWIKVKNAIPSEFRGKDFISLNEYFDLCKKFNITNEGEKITLLKYLNNLGLLLYYPDENLRYTEVINPKWVTAAVYAFLHDEKIIGQEGYFENEDFYRVLNEIEGFNYPIGHRNHIRYLMEKFRISFKLYGEEKYVIPVLLKDTSLPFESSKGIEFQLKYQSYFPKNVIPQFICLVHHLIEMDQSSEKLKVWKTGAILNDEDNRALIQADERNKSIAIRVMGDDPRNFLSYIRGVFTNQIHPPSRFPGLKFAERIPLPDKTASGEMIFVDYQKLVTLLRKGVYTCDDGLLTVRGEPYSIPELLEGIEETRKTEERKIVLENNITIRNELNLTIDIRFETSEFIREFNDLKNKLIKSDRGLKTELAVIETGVYALVKAETKGELLESGVLPKIGRFIKALHEKTSKYFEAFNTVENRGETLRKLCEGYNRIAGWVGLPKIPFLE